jgi:hypothetical protein
MAVYQGTRPRTGLSVRSGAGPRLGAAAPAVSPRTGLGARTIAPDLDGATLVRRRIRSSAAVRAGQGSSRVGILLGGIVVAFLLAFFWLAQTMRVSAIGYEIDRLGIQRDRLEAQLLELESDVHRLGGEPAIRKQALDLGLGQLAEPLVVDPR